MCYGEFIDHRFSVFIIDIKVLRFSVAFIALGMSVAAHNTTAIMLNYQILFVYATHRRRKLTFIFISVCEYNLLHRRVA